MLTYRDKIIDAVNLLTQAKIELQSINMGSQVHVGLMRDKEVKELDAVILLINSIFVE